MNKTYLVILHAPSSSGLALRQQPEMKEPDQLNYLGFNCKTLYKRKVKEYRQHLGTLEIIDIPDEYQSYWKLDQVVKEGEFDKTKCVSCDGHGFRYSPFDPTDSGICSECNGTGGYAIPAQQESNEWLTDLIDWTQGETGWYVEHYLTPKSHQQEQGSELRDELSNAYDKYKDSSYVNFIDYLFEHYKIIKQS